MKFNASPLLKREVDRKEFIILLGVFILAITGVSEMIRSANHAVNPSKKATTGFGSSPYGE